jgi:hypothetical protein
MKGSMLDMYRRPDKLLQLCDKVLEALSRQRPRRSNTRGNPKRIGLPCGEAIKPLCRTSSLRSSTGGFEESTPGLIDLGYYPMPFFEDHFGDGWSTSWSFPKEK